MHPQPPDPGAGGRGTPPPAEPDEPLLPRDVASWRPAQAAQPPPAPAAAWTDPPAPQPPPPLPAPPRPDPSAPYPAAAGWPDAPPQPWQPWQRQPWQQPAQGYQVPDQQAPGQQAPGHQQPPGQPPPGQPPPGQQPPGQQPRHQPPGAQQPGATALGSRSARDDATRYLCAAAQLSSDFSNNAIREHLLEPTRPVPPSPGFNVAAVLSEAVAARARRIVRDAALLLLAVLLVVTGPPALLLLWVLAGVLLRMFSSGRQPHLRSLILPRQGGWQVALSGFVILVLLAILAVRLGGSVTGSLSGDSGDSYDSYGYPTGPADQSVQYILAVVFILIILAVLAADRAAVWSTLTGRLRGRGQDTRPRRIHDFAPTSYNQQVQRVRQAQAGEGSHPDKTPLVVYRGYSPFVGSGRELNAWSVATSLIPLPPGGNGQPGLNLPGLDLPGLGGSATGPPTDPASRPAQPQAEQLTTTLLYERVQAEIGKLVRSTPLTPSRRLRELSVSGVVVASADELVDHLEDPSAGQYLPALSGPPNRWLPKAEAERVRADPKEWARYYQCYQVETWDRELVVSMFVHLAVDESTLYVEWKPYVLLPILPVYKNIDYLSSNQLIPFGQAVWRLVTLPASMPGRINHLALWPRRLPVDRGLVNPNRYGSLHTLRELAASGDVQNYLQRSDVYRYLKILESRFVLVISSILREFGYSSTTFDQVTATAAVSNFIIGNNFNAPAMFGGSVGTMTSTSTMTANPPAPPAAGQAAT